MILRLLRRRQLDLCNVADHFIGLPDDLPCRAEVTTTVAYRCPGHGIGTRDVCDHHAQVAASNPDVGCEFCAQAGEQIRIVYLGAEKVA